MFHVLQLLFFVGVLSQNPRRWLAKHSKQVQGSDRKDGSDYCGSCCYYEKLATAFSSSPDKLEKNVAEVIREHYAEDAVERITDATSDDGWLISTGLEEIAQSNVDVASIFKFASIELTNCKEYSLSAREVFTHWTMSAILICPDNEQATVIQGMSKFVYNRDGKIQLDYDFLDNGGLFAAACA